jgi:amino acid transporter
MYMSHQQDSNNSTRSATFLGIGAMLGAGIFALLGQAGAVAGNAVWLSFLLGGLIAILLGYSFVKLGIRYPFRGGIVGFDWILLGIGIFADMASYFGGYRERERMPYGETIP